MKQTCATCKHLVDEYWKRGVPEEEVCCRIVLTNETECGECKFLRVKLDFGCSLWERSKGATA